MLPPRRILVSVDFSEPSRVALVFAGELARRCGAELHVLNAEDPMLSAAAEAKGLDLTEDSRAELARFVEASFPANPAASIHVVVGNATDVICDIAKREGAELIVVGARGMSGVERLMFGSTTEGVLRHADISVLVVPHGRTTPDRGEVSTETGPLVVGVDFSPASLAAAEAACHLAAALGTSVELLHVVPSAPVLPRLREHAAAAVTARAAQAQQELAIAAARLHASVPVTQRVDVGSIPDRLAAAVDPSNGRRPILVLGRRTRASREGAPGATAYRVLTMAQVPVLVFLPELSDEE